MEAAIILGGLSVGVFVGVFLGRRAFEKQISAAKVTARRLVAAGEKQVALARREAESADRQAASETDESTRSEQAAIREEQQQLTDYLERKAGRVEQREEQLEKRQATVDGRFAAIRRTKGDARAARRQAKEQRTAYRQGLEQVAGCSTEQAKQQIVDTLVEEVSSQCADRLRNLESEGLEPFERQARRVMGIATQRYTGHCMRERTSALQLSEQAAPRFAALDQDALQELLGVPLLASEDGRSVRFDTGDGVARECARRVLSKLTGRRAGEESDHAKVVSRVRAEVEQETVTLGRRAFKELKLKAAESEIVDLVGKLNFRTSYTQNQYRHSIEAAHLAGLCAAELGLSVVLAKRGALMHDIGKALTHQVEGSHALIGAEIARRCGEAEEVANAVGHHHGEEPCGSAYAPLVAAADALSGGRPGARREMSESYGDRIGDLERISSGFAGVTSVHAVQAGREIRVHVDERRVDDSMLAQLSADIAAKISGEMTFPGQIRVTVIREFCALEYAN